jgi:hypothetical protein
VTKPKSSNKKRTKVNFGDRLIHKQREVINQIGDDAVISHFLMGDITSSLNEIAVQNHIAQDLIDQNLEPEAYGPMLAQALHKIVVLEFQNRLLSEHLATSHRHYLELCELEGLKPKTGRDPHKLTALVKEVFEEMYRESGKVPQYKFLDKRLNERINEGKDYGDEEGNFKISEKTVRGLMSAWKKVKLLTR